MLKLPYTIKHKLCGFYNHECFKLNISRDYAFVIKKVATAKVFCELNFIVLTAPLNILPFTENTNTLMEHTTINMKFFST